MKILVLFAHPAFHKSKTNKVIVEKIQATDGITFHDLHQEYPESYIDIKKEQELLSQHDVIVFQFPLFWYSTPSILKEWQDMVLEHGWAYGSEGNALKDKLFLCAITAGGPKQAYQEGQFHDHTINQLLSPLRQSAILCKMIPLPPFVIFGTHALEASQVQSQSDELMKLLNSMRSGDFKLDEAQKLETLNEYKSIH